LEEPFISYLPHRIAVGLIETYHLQQEVPVHQSEEQYNKAQE
jgi:hypothetical protein